jgi:4a-hydroxytetrahydrobiopterin dehydratase
VSDRTPLTPSQISEGLATLRGWSREKDSLRREYRFANFVQAWSFMTGSAIEAQALNHHPDWSNAYSRVEVHLTTHDVKGVTALDLELARRMEALAQKLISADS